MEKILNIYSEALNEYKAGKFKSAMSLLESLKEIAPNWSKAILLEAYIFDGQKNFLSEIESLKRCLMNCNAEDIPLAAEAFSRLASTYRVIGDSKSAVENFYRSACLETSIQKKRIELSNAIFAANDSEIFSMQDFQRLYDEYQKTLNKITPFEKIFYNHAKLRIGYLSADFCEHPVANFIESLMTLHNKQKFSVYGYASSNKTDKVTEQLKRAADFWRDVSTLTDEDTAKLIHNDEIDILFDLSGHTKDNRLSMMAYRPASIQISGIGYMNSTGLNFVDYFLTDKFCAEDSNTWKDYFTEKALVLSNSHFCYTLLKKFPEIREAPCVSKGYVTFGCFNNFSKVTDSILSAWQKILSCLPKSRLILKHKIFNSKEGCSIVKRRLKNLQFDLKSIEMRGFSANYLEDYRDIDIALDTFPYTGGITTCEALYMGVPVISLYGQRHGTRFGYSILNNVGIGELAVDTLSKYVDCTILLAKDFDTISVLHKNLRLMMKNSPLMDSSNYVSELEEKFCKILRG